MNRPRLLLLACFLATALFFQADPVRAQEFDGDDSEMVIQERKGIRFKLPADWPLQKKGGGIGPVPISEYLSLKFGKVDASFRSIETRLENLERRMTTLEKEAEKEKKALRSSEQTP